MSSGTYRWTCVCCPSQQRMPTSKTCSLLPSGVKWSEMQPSVNIVWCAAKNNKLIGNWNHFNEKTKRPTKKTDLSARATDTPSQGSSRRPSETTWNKARDITSASAWPTTVKQSCRGNHEQCPTSAKEATMQCRVCACRPLAATTRGWTKLPYSDVARG